ncbi:MAG: N-acetylmuramoyl-L-alanine amidase [Alcaligenaceae bacterium]|nr:N-acetylmuramoyl-L-alanine amidase [Alcaligenaceae bacterium]
MDTHAQHRRMETEASARPGEKTCFVPVSGRPLKPLCSRNGGNAGSARLPRLAGGALLACSALLAGCAAPDGSTALRIDRSTQAVSQSSRVSFVVLHYTVADTPRSLEILSQRNVSSHYLITDDEPPRIYQLVDESRRAWHAGQSEWYGRSDLNASSIGVEIVNKGPVDDGWQAYSDSQIEALTTLLRDIVARHQIHDRNVVGHSDVAPQRKQDPGPAFPWKQLADAGLGRWYDEAKAGRIAARYREEGLPPAHVIQEKLRRAGYAAPYSGTLDAGTRRVLRAVQMHFRPARHDGEPDAETLAILDTLP